MELVRDHLRRGQGHDHRGRNRTSGPVLRSGRPRLVIQEAWAWLAGTQLTRASAAAALAGEYAAPARSAARTPAGHGRRGILHPCLAPRRPVHETSQVTATSSLQALAAAGESAARSCLHTLNIPGRQRHSERKQKARPKFAHTVATKQTLPGNRRSPSSHPASAEQTACPFDRKEAKPPAPRPVEPRARPAATRGPRPCPPVTLKPAQGHEGNTNTSTT